MNELDPSASVGNQPPKTVESLSFECYERAWRGYAPDFYPTRLPKERSVAWGAFVTLTFDIAEPGVIKAVYADTPEEMRRFERQEALPAADEEISMLARVLGVEVAAFSEPQTIDPDTLSPEELSSYDSSDPLYTFGEAFGRQAFIDLNVDPELARILYDQALAEKQA